MTNPTRCDRSNYEKPAILGGQGRSAEHLVESSTPVALSLLAALAVLVLAWLR